MSWRSSDSARSGSRPSRSRLGAAAQDDLPFAREVARGASGCALDGGHLLAQGLAARHQREELAVEVAQRRAQLIQSHRRLDLHPRSLLLSAHSYRKCGGAATMLA